MVSAGGLRVSVPNDRTFCSATVEFVVSIVYSVPS